MIGGAAAVAAMNMRASNLDSAPAWLLIMLIVTYVAVVIALLVVLWRSRKP